MAITDWHGEREWREGEGGRKEREGGKGQAEKERSKGGRQVERGKYGTKGGQWMAGKLKERRRTGEADSLYVIVTFTGMTHT